MKVIEISSVEEINMTEIIRKYLVQLFLSIYLLFFSFVCSFSLDDIFLYCSLSLL